MAIESNGDIRVMRDRKVTGKMAEEEELYALPVVGGAAAGMLIGGPLGAAVGAFLVDSFYDQKGAKRLAAESRRVAKDVQDLWAWWQERRRESEAA